MGTNLSNRINFQNAYGLLRAIKSLSTTLKYIKLDVRYMLY